MADIEVQTSRLIASTALRNRVLVSVTPAGAPRAASIVADRAISGLIVVGKSCGRRVRTLKLAYGSRLLVGKDTEAYLGYIATPAQPMNLPSILGGAAYSLDDWARAQLVDGADFALTPTGQIRDLGSLKAAVASANELADRRVVLAVPVRAPVLAGWDIDVASAELARSVHPVALIVIGEFDPYADAGVASAARALVDACPDVMVHRTDLAALEPLARRGLGGSIGYTAGLRHTVTGRRPARTRKSPPDRSPIVLLPDIDSFRHRAVFEPWSRNVRPPICNRTDCCGRDLTMLEDTDADRDVANEHNLRAWLPIVEQLAAQPLANRRHWLHSYRQDVEHAYVDLRRRTGVREIEMDRSQKTWFNLGP